MRLARLREYLRPGAAEQDVGFHHDLQRTAHLGLQLVGGLEAVIPLLMLVSGIGVIPVPITSPVAIIPNLIVASIGLLTLGVSMLAWSRRHGRLATAVSVWLTSAALEWSVFWFKPEMAWIEHYLIGHTTLVKLGAATLPWKPLQMLALGLAIDVFYMGSWMLVQRWEYAGAGFGAGQHFFTLFITLGCVGLSSVVYRSRVVNYRAHQQALRTSEDLRRAQSKLLITENAAAMGRLAAALSHELNSPIGVLSSAVETLAAATARAHVNPERVKQVVEDTRRAGRESAERLRDIVARMQRFTNLDRAEVQQVSVTEILQDVVALIEKGGATVEMDLAPVAKFIARPQQLSAVFSNLVGNALQAVGENGRVVVSTSQADGSVLVSIEDNGRGMQAGELADAFNPASFRVSGNRMAAANWSLFSCRQIVQEHGGEIVMQSAPGSGTRVEVRLPLEAPLS